MYDAAHLQVSQGEAVSKDGTKIPYFQIAKKGLVLDGSHPTLLYGYGALSSLATTPNLALWVWYFSLFSNDTQPCSTGTVLFPL
jgi:prolyl oligopeptidase PreP (S9A serine peptidase family)